MKLNVSLGNFASVIDGISDLQWPIEPIVAIINTIITDSFMVFLNLTAFIFDIAEDLVDELNKQAFVEATINGMADIASTLLLVVFLKELLVGYVFKLSDSEEEPIQKLVRLSVSLAVMNNASEIHKILMDLCDYTKNYALHILINASNPFDIDGKFSEVIMDSVVSRIESLFINTVFTSLSGLTGVLIFLSYLILLITFLILIVINLVKIVFRGVELFVYSMLMPIVSIDLVTTRHEIFSQFFKNYLITMFGYIVQQMLMIMSFIVFASGLSLGTGSGSVYDVFYPMISPILACVMMYFAAKGSKWLNQFTYSAGLGGSVSAGMSSIGKVAGTASQAVGALKDVASIL